MYRFYRKINANGHSNTDFFAEGNEGNEGGAPPLITQQGHEDHKDRILALALIRFFRQEEILWPCCSIKSGGTPFVAFVSFCKNPPFAPVA